MGAPGLNLIVVTANKQQADEALHISSGCWGPYHRKAFWYSPVYLINVGETLDQLKHLQDYVHTTINHMGYEYGAEHIRVLWSIEVSHTYVGFIDSQIQRLREMRLVEAELYLY
jgi:hypothetical protein